MTNKFTIEDTIFAGKTVSFSTADETLALKNIKVETIGNKVFITGEIPKGSTTNDWAKDRPAATVWELITDYIVFDSEDQYCQLMKKSN